MPMLQMVRTTNEEQECMEEEIEERKREGKADGREETTRTGDRTKETIVAMETH